MQMLFWIIAALAAVLTPLAAAAEAEEPLIIERFLGEWRSDGPAFGAPAETVMVWTRTLGGKFYRLDYRIEMRREAGASVFEGAAYYRAAGEDAAEGYWADNAGALHPIRAAEEKNALVSHWGVEGEKYGRTRYELSPSGRMQVTDWVMGPNGWRQFNQNTFDRAGEIP